MTQAEKENVMREYNAELQSERSKQVSQIEKAYLLKLAAINANMSGEIAHLEIERDKAQEEMMGAKIAWINADTEERKTAMQCQFERVRFEQEKKCRHIRARIQELQNNANIERIRATQERDNLMRELAENLTAKYNTKLKELNDEY